MYKIAIFLNDFAILNLNWKLFVMVKIIDSSTATKGVVFLL